MNDLQNISDSEMTIMRIIWNGDGPMLLAPLMEALEGQGKSWKPNTVLTFLSRLVEKNMLLVRKKGRLNEYIATCTEKEYTETLTRSFLGKVYGGDAKGLVASLLRQDCLTKEDMDEISSFWREGKKQ